MADGPTLIAVVGLLALALFGWIALQRRRSHNVQRVPAGAEVSTGRAGKAPPSPSGSAGPARSPRPARTSTFQKWLPPKPLRFGRGGRPDTEPALVDPVVVHGSWCDSVFHATHDAGGTRFVIRAATVRGKAHAYDREPGQDAVGVGWSAARGALLLVAADGLGSLRDSGTVAQTAAELALDHGARIGPGDPLTEIFRRVSAGLYREIDRGGLEGATTLVLAELRPTRDGVLVTTCGVGDSEAWVMRPGKWKALHHERVRDSENITRHLPKHQPTEGHDLVVRRGTVVIVGSDGFAGALGGEGSPLSRELDKHWPDPPSAVDFLAQVGFQDDYFNDDRSAVAVWIQ
ncbi:protein phosphatase 2C domain-containing protein [Dactylosporangium sp. NPDC005572]|uniref:protein phosphatase 2C domain-containing protein n=1 Tax=Dactylosporangium sp. NPDC005572 TaxID=3156889 RepID=UPI0033A1078B